MLELSVPRPFETCAPFMAEVSQISWDTNFDTQDTDKLVKNRSCDAF